MTWTAEENEELVARFRAGEDVRAELIGANIPLVHQKIKHFLADVPEADWFADELVSAGLESLVVAVGYLLNESASGEENVTGDLSVSIWRDMWRAWLLETQHFASSLAGYSGYYDNKLEENLRLDIQEACKDLDDQVIIEMLANGSTVEMIAERLSVSTQTVYRRRNQIRKRLDQIRKDTL